MAEKPHVSLGAQIGYFAIFLPLALLGIFFGYQIAYRGLDHLIEHGRYPVGLALFLCGAILALVCAGLLPWFGYWLAFEGGLDSFLSRPGGAA
jgi:hypothetical protein